MKKKRKYGKILAVCVLTVLIWVWADRKLDQEYTIPGIAKITVAETDETLWVSFDGESSVDISNIVLCGPVSKIENVVQRRNKGSLKEFFLIPEHEKMSEPGDYLLDVIDFLKRSDLGHGLTVKSCDPNAISVNVLKLNEKWLTVVCVDEDGTVLEAARSEPLKVRMFVPSGWEGTKLIAKVTMTRAAMNQARGTPVEGTPYIELAPGQTKPVPTTVKITMPLQEARLEDCTITNVTLGIVRSPVLEGEYKVEVSNLLTEVMSPFTIQATQAAAQAYQDQPYQILLYIRDGEEKNSDEQKKPLVYNFPTEYVRKNEIKQKVPPPEAKFRLIRITSPEAPSAGTE